MPLNKIASERIAYRINPLEVGMGYHSNRWSVIDKFGKNVDVDTTFVPVSLGGSTVLLSSSETIDIVSTSTDDALTGTGAQKLEIQGVGNGYNPITEIVDLDGTTPVTTSSNYLRFFRAKVVQVGSDPASTNLGTITMSATTTTTVTTDILAGEGQTQTAQYAIPNTKLGYLESIFIGTDSTNIVTGQLQVRPFGEGWQTKREVKLSSGSITMNMSGSGVIPAKSDIRWIAKSNNANNEVSAGFKILLYQN